MVTKTALAILVWVSICAAAVHARNLVGTGFVDGRIVQLFDDGTWKYLVEPKEQGCNSIHESISFCDTDRRWTELRGQTFEFDRIYRFDDRHHAGFIIEGLGSDDGFSAEYMIGIALELAAGGSGVSVEGIPVHSVIDVTIDKIAGTTVIYGASVDGLKIVYANSILVLSGLSFQAISWSIGKEFTDQHKDLHEDFVSKIRVEYEAPAQ